MGQKVNPLGLRVGINRSWKSRWFVDPREYSKTLHEDIAIRTKLSSLPECKGAEIADIEIMRWPQRLTIVIHTARPGVLIGVQGNNIKNITTLLQKLTTKKIQIKMKEIKKTDTNAQIVAMSIARQLENRGSFRKAMKMAVSNAMKGGAQGSKIRVSGRLGGSDMSRTEEYKDGRVPLHTLRADIDYGFAESSTTFGKIGIKVWIYQGMLYQSEKNEDAGMLIKKTKHDDLSSSGDVEAPSLIAKPEKSKEGQEKTKEPSISKVLPGTRPTRTSGQRKPNPAARKLGGSPPAKDSRPTEKTSEDSASPAIAQNGSTPATSLPIQGVEAPLPVQKEENSLFGQDTTAQNSNEDSQEKI